MKRFRLYITAAVLALAGIMASSTNAQVLRDADFNSIGRINGNGVVRNEAGRSVGTFDADGAVRDNTGKELGVIKQLEIFNTDEEIRRRPEADHRLCPRREGGLDRMLLFLPLV